MFNHNRQEVGLQIEFYKDQIKKLTKELAEYTKEQKVMYVTFFPVEDGDISYTITNEINLSIEEIEIIKEQKNIVDYELINDYLCDNLADYEEQDGTYSFGTSTGWESSYE